MNSLKKQSLTEIDPQYVDYLPVVENNSTRQTQVDVPMEIPVDETNWSKILFSDLGSLALKGGIVYVSGGFYLLKYTKTFAAIAVDLRNGNFASIFKRTFKNVSYAPKIKMIQKLIASGKDEQALSLLDEILVDLESIDDFEMRSTLNVLRAKLHFKCGRFLVSAIYYMEAATLTSCQKLHKIGEGKEQALVNKTGMLYLISLQSLAFYLKRHEMNDDFVYWMKDLSKRATTLLEMEAKYREVDCYHFTKGGEILMGPVSLPYPTIFKDGKSAGLNRKLAIEVEKVKCLIEKRDMIRDLSSYLSNKKYLEDDADFLIEVAEQISVSTAIFPELTDGFFDHVQKVLGSSAEYSDSVSHIDVLKIQLRSKFDKVKEEDVLLLFRLLDKESKKEDSFLQLMALADKLTTHLVPESRKDFASLVLEKNYAFLSPAQKDCYEKISGREAEVKDPEINCLYPSNIIQFRENLAKLPVKDHAIIYKGQIQVFTHEMFIELVIKKTKTNFPDANFKDLGHYLVRNKQVLKYEADSLINLTRNLMSELHLEDSLKSVPARIKHQRARIGVFGLTKVGKSTFLNTLIGREILRSDRGVATNIQTVIKKGISDLAVVTFRDQKTLDIPLERIGEFTSEQGNPQNKLNVLSVEATVKCQLPDGIEVLDIPGFGVNEKNFHLHSDVIEACLGLVDGVFLITTPNDGLKSFEMDFIQKATQVKKLPFVLIANKMDELDEDEVEDLKLGLKEKLEKNGIQTNSFPTFYTSSQLGLSFIEGMNSGRFFGLEKDQAQEESGLSKVRESLKQIGDKILSLKEESVISYLVSETSKHKTEMVNLMNDTELSQKSSAEDVQKNVLGLQQQLHELEILLKTEFQKYQVSLGHLEGLDIEGMVSRLLGRIDVMALSNEQEDFLKIKPACRTIFDEETSSLLKVMGEPLERASDRIRKLTRKTSVEVQEESVAALEDVQNMEAGSGSEQLGYILDKLFHEQIALSSHCKKILLSMKSNEFRYRKSLLGQRQKQSEEILSHLQNRIKNLEDSRNFTDTEFQDKKAYYMEQISISEKYLNEIHSYKKDS